MTRTLLLTCLYTLKISPELTLSSGQKCTDAVKALDPERNQDLGLLDFSIVKFYILVHTVKT